MRRNQSTTRNNRDNRAQTGSPRSLAARNNLPPLAIGTHIEPQLSKSNIDRVARHIDNRYNPSEFARLSSSGYSTNPRYYFNQNGIAEAAARNVYQAIFNWNDEQNGALTKLLNKANKGMICVSVLPIQIREMPGQAHAQHCLVACSGSPVNIEAEKEQSSKNTKFLPKDRVMTATNAYFVTIANIVETLNRKTPDIHYSFAGSGYRGYAHLLKATDGWEIYNGFEADGRLNGREQAVFNRGEAYFKECAEFHYMCELLKWNEAYFEVNIQGCANFKLSKNHLPLDQPPPEPDYLDCCGTCQVQKDLRFKTLLFFPRIPRQQVLSPKFNNDPTNGFGKPRLEKNTKAAHYTPLRNEFDKELQAAMVRLSLEQAQNNQPTVPRRSRPRRSNNVLMELD